MTWRERVERADQGWPTRDPLATLWVSLRRWPRRKRQQAEPVELHEYREAS